MLGVELELRWGNKFLKCPATLEPCAESEVLLPVYSKLFALLHLRNIGEEDIALLCIGIPAKHRSECLRQLRFFALVNAACIHPEILKAILSRLLDTKSDLLRAYTWLARANPTHDIVVGNLLFVGAPSVRQDCILVLRF